MLQVGATTEFHRALRPAVVFRLIEQFGNGWSHADHPYRIRITLSENRAKSRDASGFFQFHEFGVNGKVGVNTRLYLLLDLGDLFRGQSTGSRVVEAKTIRCDQRSPLIAEEPAQRVELDSVTAALSC